MRQIDEPADERLQPRPFDADAEQALQVLNARLGLLILEGEELIGAKQNRIANVTLISSQPRRVTPSSDPNALSPARPVCATIGATYGESRHSESTEFRGAQITGNPFAPTSPSTR